MALALVMGGAFVEQVCLTKWTATHEAAKVAPTVRWEVPAAPFSDRTFLPSHVRWGVRMF